jgi:hypothetical protein
VFTSIDAHKETPLFPFCYGLSCTIYQYSDLKIKAGAGHTAIVTFDVARGYVE